MPSTSSSELGVTQSESDLRATLQLLADRAQYVTGASGAAIGLLHKEKIVCRAVAGEPVPTLGSVMSVESAEPNSSASHYSTQIARKDVVLGIFSIFAKDGVNFGEEQRAELRRLTGMVEVALEELEGDSRVAEKSVDLARSTPQNLPITAEQQVAVAARVIRGRIPLPRAKSETEEFESSAGQAVVSKTKVRTCAGCGFPVSEERMICFDCEATGLSVRNQSALSSVRQENLGGGWRKYSYTVGTVVMVVATVVVLWLWLK